MLPQLLTFSLNLVTVVFCKSSYLSPNRVYQNLFFVQSVFPQIYYTLLSCNLFSLIHVSVSINCNFFSKLSVYTTCCVLLPTVFAAVHVSAINHQLLFYMYDTHSFSSYCCTCFWFNNFSLITSLMSF